MKRTRESKEKILEEAEKQVKRVMKETTIRAEVQKSIIILVAVALVLVGGISCWLNYSSTKSTLSQNMKETAETAAEVVEYRLTATMNIVEIIGSIARLTNEEVALEQKQSLVDGYCNNYGWESIFVADAEGTNIFDADINVKDRDYFQTALTGTTAISDPIYSKDTGELIISIAAPLWQSGLQNTTVVGAVVITMDGSALSEVVADIQVSDNGSAYIINGAGDTIAHPDYSLVTEASNTNKEAETDSKLKPLAALETKMMNGEMGFGQYSYGGKNKVMAFAPVGINGWSLAVTAPLSDYMGSTIMGVAVTIIMLVIALVCAIGIARRIGNALGGPINKCANRLELLAEGDLESPMPEIDSRNETKVLANSTAIIVERMQKMIGDVGYLLSEMAAGNFAVQSKIGEDAYVGAFKQLILSVRKLNQDMKETLGEIHEASIQVEAGATQMAESAQNLAEGATEQAGSVEELLATVSEVTGHVEENAKATDHAHERANSVAKEAKVSQDKMHDLTAAMERIEETSGQINNIIGNIEDIATQTNLLSLNAAIEAARAGEAGKGFAVVAEQIRKLAEQSAESAVDTRKLIETSIGEVNNGGVITHDTAEYLDKVMAGLDEILVAIGDVRRASDKQAVAMEEIEKGVEQISQVVENNSAAAEETSATSEELSAQSENLNALIGHFKL